MSTFSNWSGSVQFRPNQVAYPTSEAEVQALVRAVAQNGHGVRVVGTAHSFTPLIATDHCLISLDRMQGLVGVDAATGDATFWAGTKLWRMNELLHEQGRGLENLGDIDRQSLAGIVSTGTHGTGLQFGSVPNQVREITLVRADGSLMTLSEATHPGTFKSAVLSLGTFGVLTRIRLRTIPAYRLKFVQTIEKLDAGLATLEEKVHGNRNFEFYWFPYTDVLQCKYVNETKEPARPKTFGTILNEVVMENGAFKVLSSISKRVPGTTRSIAKICGWGVSATTKVDWSHRVFVTPRWVKFQEMEYSMPKDALASAVRDIARMVERERIRVHFPVECRYVKGDDLPLSPAHGRDSAYVAVHMYRGMPYKKYFGEVEAIFRGHGGRPHWGKMHTLGAAQLKPLYPKWDEFQKLRREFDPSGVFLSPAARRLFEDGAV